MISAKMMVVALQLLGGSDPDWAPDLALARTLYETGDVATLTDLYEAALAGYRPPPIGVSMQVMVNEIRRMAGKRDEWVAVVAMAERLYESGSRSSLSTLYDTILAGGVPSRKVL